MPTWQWFLIVIGIVIVLGSAAIATWIWRSGLTAASAAAELRAIGLDLARLPGRLRRLAADERVPRKARWLLIGLAIYIASPIDPIPDFLPIIGHLDEVILVPIILVRVRRMIPADVWDEYFPKRS
ncbi:MAG TPA: DUF1232 domain-containing protein [Thermomicrobiales bacterium]|nr:DUF1232 domain-containing protein [Thermomicrobiales bacterium]